MTDPPSMRHLSYNADGDDDVDMPAVVAAVGAAAAAAERPQQQQHESTRKRHRRGDVAEYAFDSGTNDNARGGDAGTDVDLDHEDGGYHVEHDESALLFAEAAAAMALDDGAGEAAVAAAKMLPPPTPPTPALPLGVGAVSTAEATTGQPAEELATTTTTVADAATATTGAAAGGEPYYHTDHDVTAAFLAVAMCHDATAAAATTTTTTADTNIYPDGSSHETDQADIATDGANTCYDDDDGGGGGGGGHHGVFPAAIGHDAGNHKTIQAAITADGADTDYDDDHHDTFEAATGHDDGNHQAATDSAGKSYEYSYHNIGKTAIGHDDGNHDTSENVIAFPAGYHDTSNAIGQIVDDQDICEATIATIATETADIDDDDGYYETSQASTAKAYHHGDQDTSHEQQQQQQQQQRQGADTEGNNYSKRSLAVIYSHFNKLPEKYHSKKTNRSFKIWMCVCAYCSNEYDTLLKQHLDAGEPMASFPHPQPQKMVRCRKGCLAHIRDCPAFQNHLQTLPEDERRAKVHELDEIWSKDSHMLKKPSIPEPIVLSDQVKENLFDHFITLDEKYKSRHSKRQYNCKMCVCKYCNFEYQQQVQVLRQYNEENATEPGKELEIEDHIDEPDKIRKTTRDCTLHLKRCSAYQRYVGILPISTAAANGGASQLFQAKASTVGTVNGTSLGNAATEACGTSGVVNDEGGADAATATTAAEAREPTPVLFIPRKRKRRQPEEKEELYAHFITLDEKYKSKNNKEHAHYMCLCKYCSSEYNASLQEHIDSGQCAASFMSVTKTSGPEKIIRTSRHCEAHLRNCDAYKRAVAKGFAKPIKDYVVEHHDDINHTGGQSKTVTTPNPNPNGKGTKKFMDTEKEGKDGGGCEPPSQRKLNRDKVIFKHFTKLDEGKHRGYFKSIQQLTPTKRGRGTKEEKKMKKKEKLKNANACVCNYCMEEYDDVLRRHMINGGSFLTFTEKQPDRLKRTRLVCEAHLKQCSSFRRHNDANNQTQIH